MAQVADTASLPVPARRARRPSLLRRARGLLSGIFAAFLGLLPHILHHAGPLAGAALFAGVGGSLLFGALGLVAAIPFLVRLRRRCGSWRRPLATLAAFAGIFALSTFVIGPAITGGEDSDGAKPARTPSSQPAPGGHEQHH